MEIVQEESGVCFVPGASLYPCAKHSEVSLSTHLTVFHQPEKSARCSFHLLPPRIIVGT